MRNRIMFVAFMIAMIALTQIPVSPTLAYEVTEVVLDPVSGSNVDDRRFEYHEHLVADGFATSISMDLPVPLKHTTQTRFGFAVGLDGPWTEEILYEGTVSYIPYVKETSLKVQGDSYYSVASLGGITSNTGTGGPSWEFFKYILDAIGYLFTTYGIVNLVSKVYQEPPSQEWEGGPPTVEHWANAIVRQTGHPYNEPRLQTACASLMSYFNREGRNTFTITAEAKIYVRVVAGSPSGNLVLEDKHIGTYQVSYQVEFDVGLTPNVPALYGPYLYIDGQYVLQSKTYVNREYIFSAYTTDPDGDNVQYVFYWGDGTTTTTTWYSGEEHPTVTHSWSSVRTYTVKVKAYDPSGLWSESQPLTVNIVYSTWTCNYCGAQYSYEPDYCTNCDNSYIEHSQTIRYYIETCVACGHSWIWYRDYQPWVDYCGNCGAYRYYNIYGPYYYTITYYECAYCGKQYWRWDGCHHSSFTPS